MPLRIERYASINPGNSGGPLLNIHGQLIGINTAIRPDAEGIGFAIPVDRAIKVAQDLLDYGSVQRPWLGLDLSDVIFRSEQGRITAPQIVRVHRGSGAAEVGLKAGDLLLSMGEREIRGRADLNARLSELESETEVILGVWRSGKKVKVKLSTKELPERVIDNVLTMVSLLILMDSQ